MLIADLQKVSLIDYPGHISAIIFTRGCNFRCRYCHNPELVDPSLFGQCLPEEQVLSFLAKRKGKLDAICLTGGEPTLQDDLIDFIKKVKNLEYLIKIDTNGSNPQVIGDIIRAGIVDYIAMDIKGPVEKYKFITESNIPFDVIQESIKIIMEAGIPYEFRTTLVKQQLDEKDIIETAKLIKNANLYVLQQFVPAKTLDREYLNAKSYTKEEMEMLKKKLLDYVVNISIR